MRSYKHLFWLGFALVAFSLVLVACGGNPEPVKPAPVQEATNAPEPTQAPEASPTAAQAPETGGEETVTQTAEIEVPFIEQWIGSPHNDAKAEAFVHWNEDDPKEVPVNCAKCHTTAGYQDFVGADGTEAGKVDNPVPAPAGTIQCVACHNAATAKLTSVTFPGKEVVEEGAEPTNITITGLGSEARCMLCHQGRASKATVDETLLKFNAVEDPDKVAEPVEEQTLGFVNIHYYPAAATLYGTMVKGGYEYDGKSYDAKNDHVQGYDTCVGCHNPHSLEVKVEECQVCHTNVTGVEDLKNIRMAGSLVDYDGDGDMEEGITGEIEGLQSALMTNLQAYAKEKAGKAIVYTPAAHPYFFIDTNEDGQPAEDETVGDNRFNAWTGRLLRAAYNYQLSVKDPGAFAHGGKYIIQLLYDSIEDLNGAVSTPLDMTAMHRIDNGHFAGSEEAFRHWDAEGHEVPGDCAKCHSAAGLPVFLKEAAAQRDGVTGRNVAVPAANGLNCATCHNDVSTFSRYPVTEVKFPSGKVVSFGEEASANLCLLCHQGRESKVSVDAAIARSKATDDQASEALTFRNPHYFATGATLWGTEAQGAYEYDGKQYNGRFMHVEAMSTCVNCHDPHALKVRVEACSACHAGVSTEEDLSKIRFQSSPDDYDGDGNTTEGIAEEVSTMHEALYAAIQAYAGTTEGTEKIVYSAARYPYWFGDANGNGELDADDKAYATWTPKLLRAAYNYQWVAKDPGAFAHNGKYILQVLYDSLESMGDDVSKMVRPAAPAPAQ